MKRRTIPITKRPSTGSATQQGHSAEQHDVATNSPSQGYVLPACLARWTGNLLYWVADMGGQFYSEVVGAFGVNPSQVAVLQILHYEGAMRQAHISNRTRIDKATMVGLLNDLEQQRMIERRPAPHDGRAFEVHILAEGSERLSAIEEASVAANQRFFAALSADEQQLLHTLLKKIASGDRSAH